MSKLDELIQEYCPNGVEFVPLWSVTIWDKKFNSVDKKKQAKVISYPYLLAKDMFALEQENGDVFLLSTGEQTGWTTEDIAGDFLCEGEVVSIPWGKSRKVSEVMKYYNGKFVTADNRIATSSDTSILSNKYLYYWMMSQGDLIDSFYRGSGLKHPSMKDVLDMKMPLPPLEVQSEIVRILDNFTELTARKKQYEYYRNHLLTIDDGRTPVFTLGEVCDVVSGGTPSRKESDYWTNGTIKWLGSTVCQNQKTVTEITDYITEAGLNNSSAKMMSEETTLIALVGATIGKIASLPFKAAINQNIAGVYPKDLKQLNPSYVYYACTTLYPKFLALTQGSKLAMANMSFVRSLPIAVPPLDVQERLVYVLDNFDAICSDLKIGLPAEIEARQKQYEFYRDKLLSFKELN